MPDFLVKLRDGTTLVLETQGHETEQDRAKHQAAKRWAGAVSRWGELGRWDFLVCHDPQQLVALLRHRLDGGGARPAAA